MLELCDVNVAYGDVRVLHGVSLQVPQGELIAVVGANSAGKTTTIRTISGLLTPLSGSITYEGKRLDQLNPYAIVEMGIAQVPEGRRIFPSLTVRENLEMGSFFLRAKRHRKENMEKMFNLFPALLEKERTPAGKLSGGQQQMVAIARALMTMPKVLMLDEPSLGLSPILVTAIFDKIREIKAQGVTVLLVEQNVNLALAMADRGFVLENGRVVLAGTGPELVRNEGLKKAYLGL